MSTWDQQSVPAKGQKPREELRRRCRAAERVLVKDCLHTVIDQVSVDFLVKGSHLAPPLLNDPDTVPCNPSPEQGEDQSEHRQSQQRRWISVLFRK
jgi:hypothetical protein